MNVYLVGYVGDGGEANAMLIFGALHRAREYVARMGATERDPRYTQGTEIWQPPGSESEFYTITRRLVQ